MEIETQHIITFLKQHPEFVKAIKVLPKVAEKIQYIKLNIELDEETELTQVQVNLFYAALYRIEWDIVLEGIGGWTNDR